MAIPIRRIVTGHDRDGKSVFLSDGPAPSVSERPSGSILTELWATDSMPASNEGSADAAPDGETIEPPRNGTVFRVVEYPPDSDRLAHFQARAEAGEKVGPQYIEGARHHGFHKTDTVDYAIVLSGEIYALVDDGEVLMKPGDVLVQRGTAHAWSNRTDKPVQVAFVLVEANPV